MPLLSGRSLAPACGGPSGPLAARAAAVLVALQSGSRRVTGDDGRRKATTQTRHSLVLRATGSSFAPSPSSLSARLRAARCSGGAKHTARCSGGAKHTRRAGFLRLPRAARAGRRRGGGRAGRGPGRDRPARARRPGAAAARPRRPAQTCCRTDPASAMEGGDAEPQRGQDRGQSTRSRVNTTVLPTHAHVQTPPISTGRCAAASAECAAGASQAEPSAGSGRSSDRSFGCHVRHTLSFFFSPPSLSLVVSSLSLPRALSRGAPCGSRSHAVAQCRPCGRRRRRACCACGCSGLSGRSHVFVSPFPAALALLARCLAPSIAAVAWTTPRPSRSCCLQR